MDYKKYINDKFEEYGQKIRIVSDIVFVYKKKTIVTFNNGCEYGWSDIKRPLLSRLGSKTPLDFCKDFYDKMYVYDNEEFEKAWLSYVSMVAYNVAASNNGGQNPSKGKKRKNPSPMLGKKSPYPAWNKGLTKETNEIMRKFSEDRMGEGNPMYGVVHSEEYKEERSKIMKEKILNGEFTPNSNNRFTHFDYTYNGRKYRSSWEVVFQYFNESFLYEDVRIKYIDETGNERIYIIDFVDKEEKVIYEIKPKSLHDTLKYKIVGAINWCEEHGYKFVLIDEDYFKNKIEEIQASDLEEEVKRKVIASTK